MAEIVMILGESGSGKSSSLRSFKSGEVCVFNVAGKRLPFQNDWGRNVIKKPSYEVIKRGIRSGKFRRYVIDDSQYLLAFDSFARASETGYGKFTDMAVNFYNLLQACRDAPDDAIVYFLHHSDTDDKGFVRPKTLGKMLDSQLNIAGLFTIVLIARTDGSEYWFETQSNGMSVAKSPMGLFEDTRIPNDLALVDSAIRAYYNMDEEETNHD